MLFDLGPWTLDSIELYFANYFVGNFSEEIRWGQTAISADIFAAWDSLQVGVDFLACGLGMNGVNIATEMSMRAIRTLRNLSIINKAFEIIKRKVKLVLHKRCILCRFLLWFLPFFGAKFYTHRWCDLQREYDRKIYIIILKQLTNNI
jgi:hypothetical protein